jgi:hypothetical protein
VNASEKIMVQIDWLIALAIMSPFRFCRCAESINGFRRIACRWRFDCPIC